MLEGMDERTRYVAAAVAAVLAAPVATWTLLGDLSSEGFDEEELDYLFRAPAVPRTVELLAGVAALAVLVVSALVIGRALHLGHLRRPWLGTVVPLCAAGVVLGFGGRALTAGGIGANIGGGLFILFGLPLAGVLVAAAAINGWVEWRRGPQRGPSPR